MKFKQNSFLDYAQARKHCYVSWVQGVVPERTCLLSGLLQRIVRIAVNIDSRCL